MKLITLVLSLFAFFGIFTAFSPTKASRPTNSIVDGPLTKALWVFGGSVEPNPVSTIGGRIRLVSRSSGDGINVLYVSMYQPTLSSSGRYMYDDSDMAALNALAHSAGQEVWVAYGSPDWPTFGCTAADWPVMRMQDIINFNNSVLNPNERFDGVMLDVEPGAAFDVATYIGLHNCLRGVLPASIKLGTAINAFWSDPVEYPTGGSTKPGYAHIIDLPLDKVVVMGYRDTAGTDTCPTSNGLICLDRDEIAYASSIGKTEVVLAGLETMNVVPGQPENVSFFEEGVAVMNGETQITRNHFAAESSFGGFAIHNYHSAYLSGGPGWPGSAPTAADVSLSGRILDTKGRGLRNIRVVVSGGKLAEPLSVVTGPFGYFRFDGLRAGETYIVSVSGKRYVFQNPTHVISLVDDLADFDFTGEIR